MIIAQIDNEIELRLMEPRYSHEALAIIDSCRDYLAQWLPWPDTCHSPADLETYVKEMLLQFAEKGVCWLAYAGSFAGCIGLYSVDKVNEVAEIGYWLGSQFQGKGVMTRSCQAMVDNAYCEVGLNRIFIRVEPENTKSRNIPIRPGFTYEGALR